MFRRTLLVAVLVAACLPAPAEERRPVHLDDLARLRTVTDPRLSPDGTWVAYVVGTVDTEKDERGSDLWMTSWDGARHLQLTRGPGSETSPRFSPDGRWLAFLSARGDEDEKKKGAQVWLLPRDGGEATKLTDLPGGVSDFAFSPDGARLALVVKDPDPDDEPAKKDGKKRTRAPIVVDRYSFKSDEGRYLREYRNRLWLFDVVSRKAERLTSGPYDDEAPAFSPDGTSIAFVSKRGPDPDRGNDSNVFLVEARAGAEPRALTTFEGEDGGRPVFSPDGKWIAYLQGDVKRFGAYSSDTLAVVPAAGGPARLLTASLDRAVSGPYAFTPDGKSLLFSVVDDRTTWIGKVPVAGGAVTPLTTGRRVVQALTSAPNGRVAVLGSTATEPFEVHAVEKGILRPLSRQNEAWLSGLRLATTEDFTSTSVDGTVVNGLVVKPAGSAPGTKLPTVLQIHGGPNGQDQHAFSLERELLAAGGYAVLAVNYRGSSGRGSAFQKAIFGDWCHKEVVDLLGAVDEAVRSGLADPARLGTGGWSYGGILTDALVATDPRFAAAWSGAGSALQLSMYGTDQYVVQYESELGPPWRGLDPWLKVSRAFLDAEKIRTPTLFLGGEGDFNVPIAGSEQMYQALRSLGVPTRLVVYPGQRHRLTIPSYVRDRMERVLDWYGRYLGPGGAPGSR
jgi:dipeptidyl aminopeptidase/acylaminoacyl peptidase